MEENRIVKLILDLRIDFELTQEGRAARLGVSGSMVSRWESGECVPSRVHWRALQKCFEGIVSLPDLESLR